MPFCSYCHQKVTTGDYTIVDAGRGFLGFFCLITQCNKLYAERSVFKFKQEQFRQEKLMQHRQRHLNPLRQETSQIIAPVKRKAEAQDTGCSDTVVSSSPSKKIQVNSFRSFPQNPQKSHISESKNDNDNDQNNPNKNEQNSSSNSDVIHLIDLTNEEESENDEYKEEEEEEAKDVDEFEEEEEGGEQYESQNFSAEYLRSVPNSYCVYRLDMYGADRHGGSVKSEDLVKVFGVFPTEQEAEAAKEGIIETQLEEELEEGGRIGDYNDGYREYSFFIGVTGDVCKRQIVSK